MTYAVLSALRSLRSAGLGLALVGLCACAQTPSAGDPDSERDQQADEDDEEPARDGGKRDAAASRDAGATTAARDAGSTGSSRDGGSTSTRTDAGSSAAPGIGDLITGIIGVFSPTSDAGSAKDAGKDAGKRDAN